MKIGIRLKGLTDVVTQQLHGSTAKDAGIGKLQVIFSTRKRVLVATSVGVLTAFTLVIFLNSSPRYSIPDRGSVHRFRHAVIDDGVNSMNCMSGPWNDCAGYAKRRR